MNGSDYRALRRLSDKSGKTEFAAVGETCERVPVSSLPALLASGKIELVVATSEISEAAWRDLGRPVDQEDPNGEV